MGREVELKKFRSFIILIFLFLSPNFINANPIVVLIFNEIQLDSSGWKLELKNLDFLASTMDSCFLTSLTDTAYFKPGITRTDSFLVITQDSMLSNFSINLTGDIICFYENPDHWIDELSFGNVSGWITISAPKPGQSICLYESYSPGYGQTYFHYLDNTPTFGSVNDFINARGWVNGIITDSLGQLIQGVEIEYDWHDFNGPYCVWSDSNGYFILNNYAKLRSLKISKQNFQTIYFPMQIWPEDTVTINVVLNSVIDAVETKHNYALNTYKLSQNYPNPFNNSTTFIYTLPKNSFVEIAVYDLSGKLVEKLFAGEQQSGEYKVHWNAEVVASGVYVYQIKTNEFINHKKCLLIK